MKKIISVISAASIFLSCMAVTPSALAGSRIIPGWTRTKGNTDTCYANVIQSDGNVSPASGNKMLKLGRGQQETIGVYIADKLKAGTYTVKFKAYIDYGKNHQWMSTVKLGYHSLTGVDGQNGSIANLTPNTSDTTSAMWREYTATYTIKNDADGVDGSIGTNNLIFGFKPTWDSEVVFYVDDVSVTDAAGNEYVKNGGFEENPPYPSDVQSGRIEGLENKLSEIKGLLDECDKKGISTDYERVNYSVMERFIKRLNDDMSDSMYVYSVAGTHADYVMNSLDKLYDEAKSNLASYLSGKKQPKTVPRYVTSKAGISGKTFTADTVIDGTVSQRPVIFTGYGHFDEAKNEIPNFNNFGVNAIQQEIGPNKIFVAPTSENPAAEGKVYAVNDSNVTDIRNMLKSAEDSNIAVNLLLSPHYFPIALYKEKYPDISVSSAYHGLSVNIWHPQAKVLYEDYLNYIIPIVKDYKSLNNICLSNEPSFNVLNFREFYTPYFRQYLKELYNGNISALNTNYSSSYTSFDAVDMPQTMKNSAIGYDCAMFNSKVFGEWHRWMADIIHGIAPDIPVQCKTMAYYSSSAWNTASDGTVYGGQNLSTSAAFSQLNGCDTNSSYSSPDSIKSMQAWYDLMTSVKNAPVVNSEEHLVPDGSMDFAAEQANFAAASVWQGAVHGRGQSILWLWSGVYKDSGRKYMEMSIGVRPDIIAEVGKTSLDMSRLSYEIEAFGKAQGDVLMLQSDASSLYSYYSEIRDKAYKLPYNAMLEKGLKTDFATEDSIDKIDASKYKILIIPALRYVKNDTFEKIKQYQSKGGKVVVICEKSLECSEYGKTRDASAVIGGASVITKSELQNGDMTKLLSAVDNAGLNAIKVTDVSTGKAAEGIGFETAQYNGNRLLNICNYSNAAKTVRIEIDSQAAGIWTELRSESKISDEIVLEPYKPLLLKQEEEIKLSRVTFNGEFSDVGAGAVIAEDNIKNLVPGNIMASFTAVPGKNCPKSKVMFAAALYRDNNLEKIKVVSADMSDGASKTLKAVLNVPDSMDDGYALKAFLWEAGSMTPVVYYSELKPKHMIYESGGKTILSGTFAQKAGQRVTMLCVPTNTVVGAQSLNALDETVCDGQGNYSFEFPLAPGSYEIRVKCGGETRKYYYCKD